ncbi:LysR family transcriptional regulator [Pelomonas sp. KK5]|uniref:LysR family transcriptional regulator n=1 Tax=Pelomonas sp. KK5 TaxID=1855730 RepID=UPI00097C4386|nr:LysR family transcriptional regulator [Pelomonas sp. KK5]
MDRLHSLQVFCRVIDRQGFAAAAREMNLSPSVVTRLINDLEAHVGARLINRTTRRLVLTEAGEEYLEQVRRILSDLEEAEASVRSASRSLSGHLKVLAPPAFATYQLAPLLTGFRRRYPKLTVGLSAPGPVESLDEGFDVSLITARGDSIESGDFVARRLARAHVVLCASPAYLARHGRPTAPEQLRDEHEMLTAPLAQDLTLHPDRGMPPELKPYTFTPLHSPLATSQMEVTMAATIAGLCIAAMPSYAVAQAITERRLERVLPGWHVFQMAIYAAMPSRKYLPAKTRAFIDFLLEVFPDDDRDPWLAGSQ